MNIFCSPNNPYSYFLSTHTHHFTETSGFFKTNKQNNQTNRPGQMMGQWPGTDTVPLQVPLLGVWCTPLLKLFFAVCQHHRSITLQHSVIVNTCAACSVSCTADSFDVEQGQIDDLMGWQPQLWLLLDLPQVMKRLVAVMMMMTEH